MPRKLFFRKPGQCQGLKWVQGEIWSTQEKLGTCCLRRKTYLKQPHSPMAAMPAWDLILLHWNYTNEGWEGGSAQNPTSEQRTGFWLSRSQSACSSFHSQGVQSNKEPLESSSQLVNGDILRLPWHGVQAASLGVLPCKSGFQERRVVGQCFLSARGGLNRLPKGQQMQKHWLVGQTLQDEEPTLAKETQVLATRWKNSSFKPWKSFFHPKQPHLHCWIALLHSQKASPLPCYT